MTSFRGSECKGESAGSEVSSMAKKTTKKDRDVKDPREDTKREKV